MQVKIVKDIEDHFIVKFNIKKGDEFKVQFKPDTFTTSKGVKRIGYLIYTSNGKALIVYDNEIEVL